MKTIVVTVHGTGDPNANPQLVKWWQSGSAFLEHFIQGLSLSGWMATVEPFVWSGRNSEHDRRAAGRTLASHIQALEISGLPYHLVGHSHGGSVIEEALIFAITRMKLEPNGLKSVTTVGTPFIESRPKLFSANRLAAALLKPYWLTALLLTFSSLLVGLAQSGNHFKSVFYSYSTVFLGVPPSIVVQVLAVFFVLTMALFSPRYIYFAVTERWRLSGNEVHRIQMATACLRQHLWHRDDEAISGLSAAAKLRLRIFSDSKASTIARALTPFAGLLAFIFFLSAGMISLPGVATSLSLPIDWSSTAQSLVLLGCNWTFHVLGINPENVNEESSVAVVSALASLGWAFLLVAAMLQLIALLFRFALDLPIRYTIFRPLDRLISLRVKRNAFGEDTATDKAVGLGHKPPYIEEAHPALPDEISRILTERVNAGSAATMAKIRSTLGAALYSPDEIDIIGSVQSELTWSELIHTSYFDCPEFVAHLVDGVRALGAMSSGASRGGGGPCSAGQSLRTSPRQGME
ncbi:MAG: hypothetical protein EKK46_15015 [Rhodocyclaceae bacterium]|nr:MAG: hypothetical protein EKK46_15015 [Rhodocyclaceae bacterium]